MKKMMMFLMVSVFFLMGRMTASVAQKVESKIEPQVVITPSSILAQPGETVRMTFTINGIDLNDYDLIYVVIQKPGKDLELLFTVGTNGMIRYRNPAMSDRIIVFYDSSSRRGSITINWTQPEDTGDYYVAIGNADYPLYWSQGARLIVSTRQF